MTEKVQILPLRRVAIAKESRESGGTALPDNNSNGDESSKNPKVKVPRSSKPKVRTGCVTCKIRRVKCDETKPECTRCITTGRKCDGYYIPPRKNARRDLDMAAFYAPPEKCLESIKATPQELRALEYFQARTGPSLASYFDAAFWTQLVMQIGRVEPAVMHAMVAVGFLNLQRHNPATQALPLLRTNQDEVDPLAVSVPIKKPRTDHNDPFAMDQYNRAIHHLAKRLKDPDAATEVALLACILFVCIEFLRGDVEPAFKHFKGGINIALSAASKANTANGILVNQRIQENILPFFNRLELLGMMFGQDPEYEYPSQLHEVVPEHFQSFREARDSVVHLLNLSLRFIRSLKWKKYSRLILPDDLARRAGLQRQIEKWGEVLDTLLLSDNVTTRDLDAAKVLRIHQLIMKIWLGTSCELEESANDKFMVEFEAAVTLAEAVQASMGTFDQRQKCQATFLFDMEVVSPMYFVAMKCRHPHFRRRAVDVLRSTTRREGLWDSDMAAAIADRVIQIEEANLTTTDGSELPPEGDRVYNTLIRSMAGTGPSHHHLTLFTKPEGPDTDWSLSKEVIDFDVDYLTQLRLQTRFT